MKVLQIIFEDLKSKTEKRQILKDKIATSKINLIKQKQGE